MSAHPLAIPLLVPAATVSSAVSPADPAVLGGALLVLAILAGIVRHQMVQRLPLALSSYATRSADGVRIRARLGRGRPARTITAEATVNGHPVAIIRPGPPVLLGPWTYIIAAPARGTLCVTVTAESRGRRYTASESYTLEDLDDMPFAPLLDAHARFNRDWDLPETRA